MSGHRHTPHHVVILGGGITGLSAAFHLARRHPAVQITLIEKSTRFGGWVRSERVQVRDGDGNRGSVLLEAGPRTIRSNSKSILELVRHLGPQRTVQPLHGCCLRYTSWTCAQKSSPRPAPHPRAATGSCTSLPHRGCSPCQTVSCLRSRSLSAVSSSEPYSPNPSYPPTVQRYHLRQRQRQQPPPLWV